jgi:hypothetical protein
MGRGRSNPIAAQKRRLPFAAKLKREDPFRPEDEREIQAMGRRIAAAGEFMSLAGWREDAGFRVFRFTTPAKARAMQHWIDRSGIEHRPMPRLGPTAEERAADQPEALAWDFATGAVRDVVQAYRRARHLGDGEQTAFNAAADAARALGRPLDKIDDTARTLIGWAREHHREWFYGFDGGAYASHDGTLVWVSCESRERPACRAARQVGAARPRGVCEAPVRSDVTAARPAWRGRNPLGPRHHHRLQGHALLNTPWASTMKFSCQRPGLASSQFTTI